MKRIALSFSVVIFLLSCQQPAPAPAEMTKPEASEPTQANVDSLIGSWNKAWNAQDSSAIVSLFDKDAVLIDNKKVITGLDSIAAKWVGPNHPHVSGLTSSSIQQWSDADHAGFAGTYELTIDAAKGKDAGKEKGFFVVTWARKTDGWKIILGELH